MKRTPKPTLLHGNEVRGRFNDLSALDDGDGRADNRAEVGQRLRTDRQLLLDILNGQGFFDADVRISTEPPAAEGAPLTVVLNVVPGRRYYLGQIIFSAPPVLPDDLITRNFVPKTGDPIIADTVLAAEANISVVLPQNGYPFAKVGQRDILLDGDTGIGDYTLPVETGARSYFGQIRSEGTEAFGADHVAILRRFKTGDLYDSRLVDDLRAALVATGLLSTVSVEPVTGEGAAPDGTPYADLLVRQEAGPPRTLAASAGYGTGQGFRLEGSWTHRNLFPPEGSLTVAGIAGTQEQALSIAFARANAGRRDRNVEVSLSATRGDFDAFEAYTGRLGGTISYFSTPIWQKKFTWSAGAEILATSEDSFDFTSGLRDRRIYYLAALPGQVGFDRSNDLLNPTEGYRLTLRLSPEASFGSGTQFYARAILDGSYYFPATDDLVIAARARVGTISGIDRNNLAPSRRFYGGGGGSVRGFAFQELGPKDPNGDPIGGRSTNEAAVEARYRFGNFGVVGFVDAGQVYELQHSQIRRLAFRRRHRRAFLYQFRAGTAGHRDADQPSDGRVQSFRLCVDRAGILMLWRRIAIGAGAVVGVAVAGGWSAVMSGSTRDQGVHFVARQVAAFELENGLNIRIGSIEGSIYRRRGSERCALPRPKGRFCTVAGNYARLEPVRLFAGRSRYRLADRART